MPEQTGTPRDKRPRYEIVEAHPTGVRIWIWHGPDRPQGVCDSPEIPIQVIQVKP